MPPVSYSLTDVQDKISMNEEARQLRESISALEGEKETLKTEAEVKGRHEESAITSASSPPPPSLLVVYAKI